MFFNEPVSLRGENLMREKFTTQLVHGCTDEMKAEVEEMAVRLARQAMAFRRSDELLK
jgi:hypothetical protein